MITLRKFALILLAFTTYIQGSAQMLVNNSLTPQQLVEDVLVGEGVQIFNITHVGSAQSIGSFTSGNDTNIGLDAGVLLGTGDVFDIPQAADQFSGFDEIYLIENDPDLMAITSAANLHDNTILEFDFIPIGDTIRFRFVFASEEYPTFVCSHNDVFGFFLSGPNINGPYSNNSENIALVPGTTMPVSISNVNGGGGNDPNNPNCPAVNSEFYVNNTGGASIVFNGFTTVITAMSPVICGETYHIKLAIADALDGSYDSAVFLEAGSFASTPVVPEIAEGPNFIPGVDGAPNTILRSCLPVVWEFVRTGDVFDEPLTAQLAISGSAVAGVDYVPDFPAEIIFAANDTVATIEMMFPVNATGPQNIIITITSPSLCANVGVTNEFEFLIDDPPLMTATGYDLTIQCGDDAILIPAVEYGFPPYTVDWTPSGSGDTLVVSPIENTLYTALITDTCGTTVSAEFNVELIPLPPISMNLVGPAIMMEACESTQVNIVRPQGVNGELVIDISHIGGENGVDFDLPATVTIPEGNFNILLPFDPLEDNIPEEDEVITITGTFTDDCGRSVSASVTITITDAPPIYIDGGDYAAECDPTQLLPISVTASGGYNDELVITWSHDSLQFGAEANVPMTYPAIYTATATDPCGRTATTTINVVISCELVIPNVFSPNSDGMNDTWYIEGITYTTNTMRIFDRWGKMIYETRNYQNNWRAPGLSDGTYFYEIVVEKHDEPYTGHLTILRNTW